MKNILLILTTLFIASCGVNSDNKEKTISVNNDTILKTDFSLGLSILNKELKKYEKPSQTFSVSADKPSKVKGSQGTIIYI